jgi:hypothetical protein
MSEPIPSGHYALISTDGPFRPSSSPRAVGLDLETLTLLERTNVLSRQSIENAKRADRLEAELRRQREITVRLLNDEVRTAPTNERWSVTGSVGRLGVKERVRLEDAVRFYTEFDEAHSLHQFGTIRFAGEETAWGFVVLCFQRGTTDPASDPANPVTCDRRLVLGRLDEVLEISGARGFDQRWSTLPRAK